MTWAASVVDDSNAPSTGITQTATYDASSGAVGPLVVIRNNHDMFCPGIATAGDGNIVVTGGKTSEKTSVYLQGTGWAAGPPMNVPRGYQASCSLSNGQVRLVPLPVVCLAIGLGSTIATAGVRKCWQERMADAACRAGSDAVAAACMCRSKLQRAANVPDTVLLCILPGTSSLPAAEAANMRLLSFPASS